MMQPERQMEMITKLECEWCGVNCDLWQVKMPDNDNIEIVCRECILKTKEEGNERDC